MKPLSEAFLHGPTYFQYFNKGVLYFFSWMKGYIIFIIIVVFLTSRKERYLQLL